MKYLMVFASVLFIIGCAEKPMAHSVLGLAGNMEVAGWNTMPKKSIFSPKPKVIVKYVSIRDKDKDGVPDKLDKCPNTPRGLTVDHNGCPIITTLRINFDYKKWNVKKIYYPQIKKIAEILRANPHIKKIEVAGYTDNIGSQQYNLYLSKKRAEAVAKLLIKFGVSPKRLIIKGYGKKYPLVPNTTDTNRALNRRVEIVDVSSKLRNKKIDSVVNLKKHKLKKKKIKSSKVKKHSKIIDKKSKEAKELKEANKVIFKILSNYH